MKSESVRALAHVPVAASSRSLSTARSVLRVLALLVQRPAGIRADEVAAEIGKSVSTAYYLLTSLCDEGFAVHESKGVYRPARGLSELTSVAEPPSPLHEGLAGTVDERNRRRAVPADPQALLPGRGSGRADRDRRFPRPSGGPPHARPWQ